MSFCAAETVSGSSAGRPGIRPRFLAAAMPSRVRSEMRRRSKWAIAPNTWEHELAGGRGGVEAFLETHEVDALGLEGVDGLEEFTQRAAEPVEADDAEAIARSGVVDELGEPGAVRARSGGDVGEHADCAGLGQAVALSVRVLLAGGDAGIAKDVSTALGWGLQIGPFRDGFRVHTLRAV